MMFVLPQNELFVAQRKGFYTLRVWHLSNVNLQNAQLEVVCTKPVCDASLFRHLKDSHASTHLCPSTYIITMQSLFDYFDIHVAVIFHYLDSQMLFFSTVY